GDTAAAKRDLLSALSIEPAAIEALINLGDLYKAEGDRETAETYYTMAAETLPGVPTGYLRMATLAREDENRDAVVYWNDLARQAQPGGLLRPSTEDRLEPPAADDAVQDAGQGAEEDTGQDAAQEAADVEAQDTASDTTVAPEVETGDIDIVDYSE
ncbi:MAG: tetratricopeptide repeat protein, partial [Candidatus Promineifilaceae bacterium]